MRRFFIQGLLIAALVVLVAAGFLAWIGSSGGRLTPIPPASDATDRIQDIYVFIGLFASAVFLAVTVPLALFVVRFRSGGRPRTDEGPQIRGNTQLELAWTIAPVIILVLIAAAVFVKLPGIKEPQASAGATSDVRLGVEGRQFYWRFVYANGVITYDTLRVPVNQNVMLDITAPAGDVNHSFWVPALNGKFDAIPGQVNHMGFRADKLGRFPGRCAELCGIQHSVMNFSVEVVPRDEFESWLDETATKQASPNAEQGEQIWNAVCAKCHRLEGGQLVGPNLRGNTTLGDRNSLETLVRNGGILMPAVGRGWTDNEIDSLIAYTRRFAQSGGSSGG